MIRFPQVKEVHLRRSPLEEVICQVRFPVILRIANEQPVAFQDRIRKQFPQLEVEQGFRIEMEPLASAQPGVKMRPATYRFRTIDGKTAVSLAPDFFALSTTAYSHWEKFSHLLNIVNQAAAEIYEIPFASRIGLRYINRITLQNTGAKQLEDLWEIPREELTSLITNKCWDPPVESLIQILLPADGNERMILRSGFKAGETASLFLDFDYFIEGNMPVDDLMTLCNRFHDVIYRAFRWCIREDRITVFEPVLNEEV